METYNVPTLQDWNTGVRVECLWHRTETEWKGFAHADILNLLCCTIVYRLLWGDFFFFGSVVSANELQACLKTESPGLMVAACLDVGDERREIKIRPTLSFWTWDDICTPWPKLTNIEGQFRQEKINQAAKTDKESTDSIQLLRTRKVNLPVNSVGTLVAWWPWEPEAPRGHRRKIGGHIKWERELMDMGKSRGKKSLEGKS